MPNNETIFYFLIYIVNFLVIFLIDLVFLISLTISNKYLEVRYVMLCFVVVLLVFASLCSLYFTV